MRRSAFLLSMLALSASTLMAGCATGSGNGDSVLTDPVVVYLVRHAERAEDGTNDPSISEEGRARAEELAALLSDAGIDHVHSTDLKRTRQTGAPLVDATGLPVEVYDPRDLPAFAATLKATPGRHLVLGHSNTTPELASALGGIPVDAIAESEYDRLYVVVIPAVGPASTTLLRFGARYVPEADAPELP